MMSLIFIAFLRLIYAQLRPTHRRRMINNNGNKNKNDCALGSLGTCALNSTGQRSKINANCCTKSAWNLWHQTLLCSCLLSSGAETGSTCKLKISVSIVQSIAIRVCRMMQPVDEDNLLPPTDFRPIENINCNIKLTFKLKLSSVCVIYSIPPMRIDTKPMNKQIHTTMGNGRRVACHPNDVRSF